MSECAVLASITKNPTRLNPVTHPENNASRRSLVLQNMLEQHYITKKEYREALSDDVYTRIQKNAAATPAKKTTNSYFEDALILQVVKDLKKDARISPDTIVTMPTSCPLGTRLIVLFFIS